MSRHEHFEELGALAVLGEISGEELEALNTHLSECVSCRLAKDESALVLSKGLPLAGEKAGSQREVSNLAALDATYRERFLARGRAEGIRFSDDVERKGTLLGRLFVPILRPTMATGLAILTLTGAVAIILYNSSRHRIEQERMSVAELRREVSGLSSARARLGAQLAGEAQAKASLEAELSKTREASDLTTARASALQSQLAGAMADVKGLREELERSSATAGESQSRLKAEEQHLAELESQIQKLRAARADNATTIANQQLRIEDLSGQLHAQTELIDRERELMAAGRDIRNLMGARNLHIVDVRDLLGDGKHRRAFGRVFYTEGKSLIFYAFDLTKPRQVAQVKHSFQAWGNLQGSPGSPKNLGIFYVDDAAQRRWLLKVENPALLVQIDAVFVTVEPFGGTNKPTGQTLLYAFLGGQANHP